MNFLNCRRMFLDKDVKGVSIWPVIYYIGWAGFGIYYFTTLQQPFSAALDILMILGYVIWLWMAIRYRTRTPSVS